MITAAAGTRAAITVFRLPGSRLLDVRGSLPLGADAIFRNVSVDNPTQYFVNQLRDVLTSNGVNVVGPAVDIDEVASPPHVESGTLLLMHRSEPLSTLATTMMKVSQNLYAETLLKTLAAPARPRTAEAGRSTIQATLASWNIDPAEVLVADGSGLSRYNLATPDALVAVLTRAAQDERLKRSFDATLPIAGRDGTLSLRMRGTAADGNAQAKTGSLSNVRAISGYVRSGDGEPLVFSILANNFGSAADMVETTEDAIIVKLAEFSRVFNGR